MTTNAELLQAAIAIIERWDSPLWKDLPATAEYIRRLRKAVDNAKVFHTKPSTDSKDMSATDISQIDGVKMAHEIISVTEPEMAEIIDRCSDSGKERAYQNGFYVLTYHEIMKVVNELVKIRNHKNH